MTQTQTITDPDALAILGYKGAPASGASSAAPPSGITDPDALAILQSAKAQAPAQWTPEQQAQADAEAARGAALFQPSTMDTVLSNIKDAGTAEWHHLGNIGVGIAQDLAHGLRNTPMGAGYALGEKLMGPQQTVGGLVSGQAPSTNPAATMLDKYAAQREQSYQQSQPESPGTYIGAGMGEFAPFVVGGEFSAGAKLGQAADAATAFAKGSPTLQRILSGVLQGSAIGATQPVTSGDFGQQKAEQIGLGAATGGALPAVGALGSQAYGLIKPILKPMGVAAGFVHSVLGDEAPAVSSRLRNAPQLVPGSMPTSAQVGGSVPLVQAEKALANQSPDFKGALMNRQMGNNAARLDAVQALAGSPADQAAAVQARNDATRPFIENMKQSGAPADVSPVVDALQKLKNSDLGVRPTIKGAVNDLLGELTSRAPDGKIDPGVLHGLRQNIGDYLRKNAPNGAYGTQEGVAFGPIKDSITQALEQSNPGYSAYLADYARLSQPITDQRAASGIMDGVGNVALGADQRPQLTLTKLNSLLKQANKGDYPLSPQAQDELGNVQRDLQRETVSNSVRTPGSDTAYNLQAPGWLASKFYGANMQGAGPIAKLIGAGVGSVIPGVGTLGGYLGADKLSQFGAKRVMNAAQDLMLNPATLSKELDKLAQKNPQLAQYLGRLTQQTAASRSAQLTQQP